MNEWPCGAGSIDLLVSDQGNEAIQSDSRHLEVTSAIEQLPFICVESCVPERPI
jgi:hypothetical protein